MTFAPDGFQLLVFHRTVERDRATLSGGASGVVVDFETRGKAVRQQGRDTEINDHTLDDIRAVKGVLGAHVICRINPINAGTPDEIEAVLDAGSDEILVPMVRGMAEAEAILEIVDGRRDVALMIETVEAMEIVADLNRLPVSRFYLGLNDLCISRGASSIFSALEDGTVDAVRRQITNAPFGFAGLTLPERGHPLPTQHLINEIARLDCAFTFLRRSYFRDIEGRSPNVEIPRILAAVETARCRRPEVVAEDYRRCREDLATIMATA